MPSRRSRSLGHRLLAPLLCCVSSVSFVGDHWGAIIIRMQCMRLSLSLSLSSSSSSSSSSYTSTGECTARKACSRAAGPARQAQHQHLRPLHHPRLCVLVCVSVFLSVCLSVCVSLCVIPMSLSAASSIHRSLLQLLFSHMYPPPHMKHMYPPPHMKHISLCNSFSSRLALLFSLH